MDRRTFLAYSGAGTLAASMNTSAQSTIQMTADTELLVMATDWGFSGGMEAFCEKAKTSGYDGIEVWWPNDKKAQTTLKNALEKYGLKVGFLCGGSDNDYKKHLEQYKKSVTEALEWKPVYINSHSGKDFFTFDQNALFVAFSIQMMKSSGIPIYHETHRGRMCYSAPITRDLLGKYPEMKLTLDISHWVNVHESMMWGQEETLEYCLKRVGHIHARIGHPEGPQVNDPRAPEWKSTVEKHLEWWDTVVKAQIAGGKKQITFLTEFGPPTYMQTLPYTQQPVADQWEINKYMLDLLKGRYKK